MAGGGNGMLRKAPIELITLLYMISYVPYMVITKRLSSTPAVDLGRPLTGLEILPGTLILSGVFTVLFVWLAGWWRSAHVRQVGRFAVPTPTRWTVISGLCTGLVLFTVPLSLTFEGVSIPFIQLLMRGDVLILAPLVDMVSGRKVRWYSWAALGLVAIGLFFTIRQRGGLHLPPLAIATVILYTIGYFGRLAVMTKVSKTGDPESVKAYFVEEKMVGIPFAVLMLAAIPLLGLGAQADALDFGFVQVWTSAQLLPIIVLSALLFVVSVFAAIILLDPRENTFCVPLERAASIIAGIFAAFLLAWMYGQPAPTSAEVVGVGLMIAAVFLLSIGPRLSRPRAAVASPSLPRA